MSTTIANQPAASPAAPEPPSSSPLVVTLRTVGIALAAVVVAWAAVQAADWAASSEGEERLSYDSAVNVELVADGPVTVRVGQVGTVEVRREWREGLVPVSFEVSESSDRLVVTHGCPWFLSVCRAGLEVSVPEDTDVVVRTSDGHIEVAGIAGDLVASTGSGPVLVERVGGDVDARTSSGRVEAIAVDGDALLSTGSGSIAAEQIGGSLEARTSSGRIDVRDVGGEALTHTGSGHIVVASVLSHVDAYTSSGRVTVHGNGAPVALDISTSSGSQTVEAPTDPGAPVKVKIRSSSGAVEYLGPVS